MCDDCCTNASPEHFLCFAHDNDILHNDAVGVSLKFGVDQLQLLLCAEQEFRVQPTTER